jgi:hypothetical protein
MDTKITVPEKEYSLSYPRIIINNSNVNYNSDLLKIKLVNEVEENNENTFVGCGKNLETIFDLEKYYDYSILLREGKPCFNIKINGKNNFYNILNYKYYIDY